MAINGSCYCGAIEYELKDDGNRDGVLCHCVTCQKLHTSHSYNVKSSTDAVTVTKGQPKEFVDTKADVGKPVHRFFCGDCGSYLWTDPDSLPGVRFVKVGPLHNADEYKLAAEIYVDTALPPFVMDKSKFGQKHFQGMMAKEV